MTVYTHRYILHQLDIYKDVFLNLKVKCAGQFKKTKQYWGRDILKKGVLKKKETKTA